MKYVIIKCEPLGDQWECDADRTPICVVDDYEEYKKYGYEVYEINPDNSLKCIQEYEDYDDDTPMIEDMYDMVMDYMIEHGYDDPESDLMQMPDEELIDFYNKYVKDSN